MKRQHALGVPAFAMSGMHPPTGTRFGTEVFAPSMPTAIAARFLGLDWLPTGIRLPGWPTFSSLATFPLDANGFARVPLIESLSPIGPLTIHLQARAVSPPNRLHLTNAHGPTLR